MIGKIKKEYKNGDITMVGEPHKYIQSKICFNGLPKVFNPNKRLWILTENTPTEKIINQVQQCPSQALTFFLNS